MTSGFLHLLSPIKISGGTEITSNQIKVGNITISSTLGSSIAVGEKVVITTTDISLGADTILENDSVSTPKVIANQIVATTITIGETEINNQITSKDFIIRGSSQSVKNTISSHTNTLATHTQQISELNESTNTMSQNIATQGSTIQTLTQRMNELNFNGGYGIFGRLNDNDDYKNKLVGHIAAVGPLVYGFLYDGKTISEKNDGFEHIIIDSIDSLWTNCDLIAPQNDILINWNGGTGGKGDFINSNKIRTFKITHTSRNKIKFEYIKGHNYTAVVEPSKTFFWYTRSDVEAEVSVQTTYNYSFAGEFRVPTTGWITDGISKCQTSYEIDKPAYICTDPSTRNITITGIDYSVEMIQNALDIAGGNLQNDRLYALVDSCSEEQGKIFITFFAASAPSSPININMIITAKGYK